MGRACLRVSVTEPVAVELLLYVFIFFHITATSFLPPWLPFSGRALGFDMMTLSKKNSYPWLNLLC